MTKKKNVTRRRSQICARWHLSQDATWHKVFTFVGDLIKSPQIKFIICIKTYYDFNISKKKKIQFRKIPKIQGFLLVNFTFSSTKFSFLPAVGCSPSLLFHQVLRFCFFLVFFSKSILFSELCKIVIDQIHFRVLISNKLSDFERALL